MKIIISHDVDHLYVGDHVMDSIIPKAIARATIEMIIGITSFSTWRKRLVSFFRKKWNRIDDLMLFDREQEVPATFFFGMNTGLGLNYSVEDAIPFILEAKARHFDVGVHGISFDDERRIQNEFDSLAAIVRSESFGVRMHYLRMNEKTKDMLSATGYLFDSSDYGLCPPSKIGTMWEFPVCLMDTYLFQNGRQWQNVTLAEAKRATLEMMVAAMRSELPYFSVLFHDCYFDDVFPGLKSWYVWLVRYARSNGIEMISFRDAVVEMEQLNNIDIAL